jgi:hypothetical protein
MPDDLDQYFQCVEARGRWEFQVGVVIWVDGPHSPRLVWKSYRKWTKPPTTERLARAKAAALNDARLFRVCTRCRQWHNSGHMFDMETCRSCASCLFGTLY